MGTGGCFELPLKCPRHLETRHDLSWIRWVSARAGGQTQGIDS